jgi:hypothetical protein
MKPNSFFITTAISTILQVMLILLSTGLSYFIIYFLMKDSVPIQEFTTPLFSSLSGFCCLSCLINLFLYLGTGFLYAWVHHREAILSLEDGAIGGSVSSGLATLITGIFSSLLSILLTPLMLQMSLTEIPSQAHQIGLISSLFSGASSFFGACFSALFATALGAIGGLIGGAVFGDRV